MTDVALIPLRARDGSVRAYATIDAADEEWATQFRWSLTAGYASRKLSRTLCLDGKQRTILMHRALLGLEEGDSREGDHINRDKLDNRRANLRAVTKKENRQNVPGRVGATSRYRGVCWDTKSRKWRATVQIDYRVHAIGLFDDEDVAGDAIAAYRSEHMPFSTEAAA